MCDLIQTGGHNSSKLLDQWFPTMSVLRTAVSLQRLVAGFHF